MNRTLTIISPRRQSPAALSDSPTVQDLPSATVETSSPGVSSKQPGRDGALIISFSLDGKARCVYSDLIPLQDIGTLEVKRASSVEFNEASQQWEVTITGENQPRFSHPSRDECLRLERDYINEQLHAPSA